MSDIEQDLASALRNQPPVTADPRIIEAVLARIARQRKRRLAAAAAAAVFVIAVAAVAVRYGDRPARGPAGPVASRHPDPILARIGVGPGPVGAMAALGADVWAVTWHGDLVRIDTRTNTVTLREHIPGLATNHAANAALASGGGQLWLAALSGRSVPSGQAVVLAINPATGHVIARVNLGGICYSENTATNAPIISYGAGHLWVVCWAVGNSRRIVRIDPASERPDANTGVIPGSGNEWIVAGPEGIWYSTDTTKITKVDPSGTRLTRVTVSDGYTLSLGAQLALGRGALWALASDGTIARIDPATGRITRVYRSNDPNGTFGAATFAVGFGSVWVEGAALLRLNPKTFHVQARAGPAGNGDTLTLSRGAIWIGTENGVVRVDPALVPG